MQLFRRKKFLIRPKFQIKYSLIFSSVVLVLSSTIGIAAFYSFKKVYQDFLNAYHHQPAELVGALEDQLYNTSFFIFTLLIALSVVLFILTIFMTHRAAGPAYKISTFMKEIAEGGDLKKQLYFRKGDEFTDLADNFNAMMKKVREDLKKEDK